MKTTRETEGWRKEMRKDYRTPDAGLVGSDNDSFATPPCNRAKLHRALRSKNKLELDHSFNRSQEKTTSEHGFFSWK
jgi:hypothetical protein